MMSAARIRIKIIPLSPPPVCVEQTETITSSHWCLRPGWIFTACFTIIMPACEQLHQESVHVAFWPLPPAAARKPNIKKVLPARICIARKWRIHSFYGIAACVRFRRIYCYSIPPISLQLIIFQWKINFLCRNGRRTCQIFPYSGPLWVLLAHQDTNCLISWVAFFNLRICRRLNLRAIKLPGRMKKRRLTEIFKARHLFPSRQGEKLQAFFSSRVSFIQKKCLKAGGVYKSGFVK